MDTHILFQLWKAFKAVEKHEKRNVTRKGTAELLQPIVIAEWKSPEIQKLTAILEVRGFKPSAKMVSGLLADCLLLQHIDCLECLPHGLNVQALGTYYPPQLQEDLAQYKKRLLKCVKEFEELTGPSTTVCRYAILFYWELPSLSTDLLDKILLEDAIFKAECQRLQKEGHTLIIGEPLLPLGIPGGHHWVPTFLAAVRLKMLMNAGSNDIAVRWFSPKLLSHFAEGGGWQTAIGSSAPSDMESFFLSPLTAYRVVAIHPYIPLKGRQVWALGAFDAWANAISLDHSARFALHLIDRIGFKKGVKVLYLMPRTSFADGKLVQSMLNNMGWGNFTVLDWAKGLYGQGQQALGVLTAKVCAVFSHSQKAPKGLEVYLPRKLHLHTEPWQAERYEAVEILPKGGGTYAPDQGYFAGIPLLPHKGRIGFFKSKVKADSLNSDKGPSFPLWALPLAPFGTDPHVLLWERTAKRVATNDTALTLVLSKSTKSTLPQFEVGVDGLVLSSYNKGAAFYPFCISGNVNISDEAIVFFADRAKADLEAAKTLLLGSYAEKLHLQAEQLLKVCKSLPALRNLAQGILQQAAKAHGSLKEPSYQQALDSSIAQLRTKINQLGRGARERKAMFAQAQSLLHELSHTLMAFKQAVATAANRHMVTAERLFAYATGLMWAESQLSHPPFEWYFYAPNIPYKKPFAEFMEMGEELLSLCRQPLSAPEQLPGNVITHPESTAKYAKITVSWETGVVEVVPWARINGLFAGTSPPPAWARGRFSSYVQQLNTTLRKIAPPMSEEEALVFWCDHLPRHLQQIWCYQLRLAGLLQRYSGVLHRKSP